MKEWLAANITNILVCLALGGVIFLSIFATLQSRKKGKSPCGGNCACCGACTACKTAQEVKSK